MKYNTLGFTLFRKCTASCAMCCFEATPSSEERLDVERIKSYIDEAGSIDDITTISFTGGEPFIEYDLLLELVSYASKNNKISSCISNGFWATSYEKAYSMLKRLKDAGLKRINFSHDKFHKKYVRTEYVKNALMAARDIGLRTSLGVIRTKDEDVGEIINDLGNSLYGVILQVFTCYPAGGALKCLTEEQFDRTIKTEKLHCIYDGNIVVAFDGTIYPCCSQMVVETGLQIGNFQDITLKEALKKIKNNGILFCLRNKELDFFAEIAQNDFGMKIPDYVTNPCELCAQLLKKEILPRYLPYVKKAVEKEIKMGKDNVK